MSKQRNQNPDETPESDETPETPTAQEMQADQIDELLHLVKANEFSAGTIRIFKRDKGESDFSYVDELPALGFDLQQVKNLFGGGSYQFKVVNKGKFVKHFSANIKVIEPKIAPNGNTDLVALAKMISGEKSGNSDSMLPLIIQMQQQNTQMIVSMMGESQKTMATMVAALAGGKSSGEPVSKLLEAISPVFTAALNKATSSPVLSNIREMKQIKELFDTEAPAKEESGGILKELAPLLAPLAISLLRKTQQPSVKRPAPAIDQPRRESAPDSANTPENIVTLEPNENPDDMERKILINGLRQFLPMILNMAANDKDPISLVDLIEANLNERQLALLKIELANPNWLVNLFGNEPTVLQFSKWFDEVKKQLLEPELEPDETNSTNEPKDNG